MPSQFRTPGTFTITRLQSPHGFPDRITKLSPVPALLVSISLKSLPSSSYQVWTADKLIPTSIVRPFRTNVIDFESQPSCWAGSAFDYVHYSVPRRELDDISEDLLAPWQKRRASELLHENMHGRIRLSEIARECGLSVSHFARSFKASFGTSTHQWLIQHRIDHAKQLMGQTGRSLIDIAIQLGFNDQAAFTRTYHQLVGVAPGRWRRRYMESYSRT